MDDQKFMATVISEICDYAIDNGLEPDETLSIIADNIKRFLEIASCNGWKRGEKDYGQNDV